MAENIYKTASGFEFYQDFEDSEGMLTWKHAKTLDRYHELKDKQRNFSDPCMFYAFSNEQYEQGEKIAKQHMQPGEEILRGRYGMFATQAAYNRWVKHVTECDQRIKAECDPQEVYCYEYNNYECCISWEGDEEAIKVVRAIFGEDVEVKRFNALCK